MMEALEAGLQKYFGKMNIPKTWSIDDVCYYLDIRQLQVYYNESASDIAKKL